MPSWTDTLIDAGASVLTVVGGTLIGWGWHWWRQGGNAGLE